MIIGILLAFALLAPTPAIAGLGGSVVPSFPTPLNIGDIKTASITVMNRATTPNNTENVNVSGIFFTPSCAATDGYTCTAPDVGVFQFATVVGRVGSSCANIVFSLGPQNPSTGEFELIPPAGQPVLVGPSNGGGPLPNFCVVSINFKVLRAPQDSTPLDVALTTNSLAHASMVGASSGTQSTASGGNSVTINTPATSFTTTPGNAQVALSWSADPTPSSYKLVFKASSSPASCSTGTVLVSGTATSYLHTGLSNGTTYFYRLCTVDNAGLVSAGTTTSAMPRANSAPVANAGPSQTAQTLTSVTLNGSGSTDSDGTIVSYSWSFGDGNSASGAIVSHAYATAGTYTATLTVTDNGGATGSASTTVTVTNRPPVANAGPNQSTQTSNPISLNGSGSSDPDGTIVSYSWNFGDGTSGSGVTVSHTYSTVGTYTATLTVTDNSGASASASAVITVSSGIPAIGAFRWSTHFGGAGSAAVSYATAVDSSGNIVIAGAFWGTVNLGGSALTSAGGSDIFVAKYSPNGAHLWSKRFGGIYDDVAQGIAVDSGGNVILVGSFKGTVNFGGSALSAYYGGFGQQKSDFFMVKFSSTGAHVWSKGYGSFGDDVAYGVATDDTGNVVVAGSFVGHVDVGGVTLVSTNDSADIFLAKYAPAGQLVWANSFGGAGTDTANGVAADAGGNIFMTGTFVGTVDFGGGTLSSMNSSTDVFLAKYSSSGQHLWSKRFGDSGQDVGYGVATDPAGNVAMTGYFQGAVDFGGGPVTKHGSLDTFVAKYSPTGAYLWSFGLGGTNADEGFDVAMDAAGNVVIVGAFQGAVDFGSGPLTSAGSWDVVVAKYSAGGAPLWSKRFGGTGDDLGYAIAVDGGGNVIVTGYFQSAVNFGGGQVTAVGDTDVFIVNLAP